MTGASRKTDLTTVRASTRADAAMLAALHRDAWRYAYRGIISGISLERMIAGRGPDWWRRMHARGGRTLVLELDGQVMGYVTFGPSRARTGPPRGEIYELYVRPEAQGVGFGRRLFDEARRRLRAGGLVGLVVWSLAENDLACRFYRALGGQECRHGHSLIGGNRLALTAFAWP